MLWKGLLMLWIALAQTDLYRWVDAEGNVHFSDLPPSEGAAQEVTVEPDITRQRQAEALARQAQREADRTAEADMRAQREALESEQQDGQRQQQAQNAQRCQRAQNNLRMLRQQIRLFSLDEQGERVYYDDATRAARISREEARVEQYCR